MYITAFFTNNGIPATGLSPTIRIREVVLGNLVVTDASMTEVGDGWYQYNFTSYDKDIDYVIRCDGGVLLSASERYTYAGNENYIDDINETVSQNVSASNLEITDISTNITNISNDIKRLLGLVHENIFIDNPSYDTDGNLISARVRIYSNSASVGTANDIIGTYQISAPSNLPGQFTSWKQVRTS